VSDLEQTIMGGRIRQMFLWLIHLREQIIDKVFARHGAYPFLTVGNSQEYAVRDF